MLPARPVYPQQATFAGRCPLSCRFGPLYPQQQTFLVVSLFVWFCRVGPGNFTPSTYWKSAALPRRTPTTDIWHIK
jgi:hypothetical protein